MNRIVYIGILSADVRGIEDLCEAIISIEQDHPGMNSIDFYGFGPLEGRLNDLSRAYTCINFHGKLESGRQREVYSNYDMMAAFYYTHNCPVHVYAAPNKFFDHLTYGLPILTNHGHSFAEEISRLGSGIVTEENMRSIRSALLNNAKEFKLSKRHLNETLVSYQQENYKSYCDVLI